MYLYFSLDSSKNTVHYIQTGVSKVLQIFDLLCIYCFNNNALHNLQICPSLRILTHMPVNKFFYLIMYKYFIYRLKNCFVTNKEYSF